MKKLFLLSTIALAVSTAPALAEHHEKDGKHKDRIFVKMDSDGNGVVEKEEFMDHTEERFDDMDINNDGEITKDEAEQAHEKMREKFKEMRAKMKDRKDAAQDKVVEE